MVLGRSGADLLYSAVTLGGADGRRARCIGWRIDAGLGVGAARRRAPALAAVRTALGRDLPRADVPRRRGPTTAIQVLVWPVGFLSNAFVSPETMPAWLGAIAQWNPISATATAARQLFGNPSGLTGGWFEDNAILLAVAASARADGGLPAAVGAGLPAIAEVARSARCGAWWIARARRSGAPPRPCRAPRRRRPGSARTRSCAAAARCGRRAAGRP